MDTQTRIYQNTSAKEVFDPQLGVTIPAHGRVSVSGRYHMPPSKVEIVDVTDTPEQHTAEAIADLDARQGRKPEQNNPQGAQA